MRRFLLILALALSMAAQAQTTVPIPSPRNGAGVVNQILVMPVDAKSGPLRALAQGFPPSDSFPSSVTLTFPASQTAYTITALRALVTATGAGFFQDKDMISGNPVPWPVNYPYGPLLVPAGIPVIAVMNFPLIGSGDLTVSLGPDTVPPSTPALAAMAALTTAAISWTAATDNVGVTGYVLERAPGTLGAFAQIALTASTSFADAGLTAATTYSYRIKATDAAGNFSPYSAVAVATTQTPPPPVSPVAASTPGQCTGPAPAPAAAVVGCSGVQLLPQLIDAKGQAWTLVKGVPLLNGKPTSNPYSPNISYLYVSMGSTIRSQNSNGTYWCVNPVTNAWQAGGC